MQDDFTAMVGGLEWSMRYKEQDSNGRNRLHMKKATILIFPQSLILCKKVQERKVQIADAGSRSCVY